MVPRRHGDTRYRMRLITIGCAAAWMAIAQLPSTASVRTPTFVAAWGSPGTGNGQFNAPFGLATDANGNVYVADAWNHRVQKFTSSGAFVTAWGSNGVAPGQFNYPRDIAVDPSGFVFVVDGANARVQKFTQEGVFVSTFGTPGSGDGQFNFAFAIDIDAAGNIYVTERDNHRVQKFTNAGVFITRWGSFGTGDGHFWHPAGIAVDDSAGVVYVVDASNARIQKFTTSGSFVSILASPVYNPWGVQVDRSGNVYVVSEGVRKYSATGSLLATFGPSGTGDGRFANPYGITFSPSGATLYVTDIDTARVQQFALSRVALGLGSSAEGWFEDMFTESPHAALPWLRVNWAAYNSAVGVSRPAFCDLDGDNKDELVLGLASYPADGGYLEIKDDAETNYAHLTWIRVNWPAYNASNGETWPACGDIDGDGRDEIVVGVGNGGNGWVKIFDDATTGYAAMPGTPSPDGWLQVPFPSYNMSNGSTHPAVASVDGDKRAEIVVGLGRGGGGWMYIADDAVDGFGPVPGTPTSGGWLRLGWPTYDAANGETWPAVGDLEGDGQNEIVVGVGSGGNGWLRAFRGATGGFIAMNTAGTPGGWVQVPFTPYNMAVGATYPALGDLDGDGKAEVIVGLGTYTADGGWVEIRHSLAGGLAHRAWARVAWPAYNGANGLVRPAVTK